MAMTLSDIEQSMTLFTMPLIALSAVSIILTCIAIISRMDGQTSHVIRLFYTTIATGGFGELCAMLVGKVPTIYEFFLTVGIGMLFLFDRRSGWKPRPPCRECPEIAEYRKNKDPCEK